MTDNEAEIDEISNTAIIAACIAIGDLTRGIKIDCANGWRVMSDHSYPANKVNIISKGLAELKCVMHYSPDDDGLGFEGADISVAHLAMTSRKCIAGPEVAGIREALNYVVGIIDTLSRQQAAGDMIPEWSR
jgi:hypothetical protein